MASIHDVARVAGVSISTVSYALSGKRSIAESTKRRVADAARQLGYRPNAGARMLAGTRTNIFALSAPLHPDTYPPAHMTFVLSVVTAARAHDYDVLLLTQDEATNGLRRVSESALVDGIILMDISTEDERAALVGELDRPVTLIGIPADTTGLTCVDLDFEEAARLAVRRLVEQGHREIGMLGHPHELYDRGSNFPPRFRDAFLEACIAQGVEGRFRMAEQESASVRNAFDALRDELPNMSALVLHCNEPVQGMLLDLLRDREISIPGDLSVISACSSFDTAHFQPPLDLIPLPAGESGRRAVELTFAQLGGFTEPVVELIPPEYREHGSTAAPASARPF